MTREEFIARAAAAITQRIGPERFRLEVAEAALEAVGAWELYREAKAVIAEDPLQSLTLRLCQLRAKDATAKAEGR